MTRREWIGIVAIGVGVALLLAEPFSLPADLERVVLVLAGLLVGVGGLAALVRPSLRATPDSSERDSSERLRARIPGEELADESDAAIRTRLRELAGEALVKRGDERADSLERIETGSWTDDEIAREYLRADSQLPSLGTRLAAARSGRSVEEFARHRTVVAIERRWEDQ